MPDPHPHATSRRAALLLAPALALLCGLAVVLSAPGSARGQGAEAELEQVRDREGRITARLAGHNRQVNRLIGEVSRLREREGRVAAQLADAEAELAAADERLDRGRERLRALRSELADAIGELERMLVAIYKSGRPDVVGLLLNADSFDDLASDAAYLERLRDYEASVVARVESLRDEQERTVDGLAADRERIESSRDAIAARRTELAASRADLQAQESELRAMRRQRRAELSRLEQREGQLVRRLSRPEPEPEPEPAAAPAGDGGSGGGSPGASVPAPSGGSATIGPDGDAIAPADAPAPVKAAIAAANEINGMPYKWGGGHGSFEDSGYDCSGAISYALNGGGLLDAPLDSTGFMTWGSGGEGNWITVYANPGHAYVVIAGLRFDTSGTGGSGPRWQPNDRSPAGLVARHPAGL